MLCHLVVQGHRRSDHHSINWLGELLPWDRTPLTMQTRRGLTARAHNQWLQRHTQ